MYGNASEVQAATYDRNHPRYPYKSHGQWLKACYGMVACTILLLFNGITPFLERPFDVRRFIASYISVSPDHALVQVPSSTDKRLDPCVRSSYRGLQSPEARLQNLEMASREVQRLTKRRASPGWEKKRTTGASRSWLYEGKWSDFACLDLGMDEMNIEALLIIF